MPFEANKIIDSLSVDCVIFGFEEAKLKVLLIKQSIHPNYREWALPGGFIKYNESIDDSTVRILKERTGIKGIYMEQLKAFGDVERFPENRVITIAYYALVRPGDYPINPIKYSSEAKWFKIEDVPKMPFDHNLILKSAHDQLKKKVRNEPIGFNLLPDKFTLLQLQELYEAIYTVKFDKPNFRRKILKMDFLIPLDEKQTGVAHRYARLYKFDKKRYDYLIDKGFSFEI